MRSARRQGTAGLLLAAVLAAAISLTAQATGALHVVEQRTVAARFAWRGASPPADVAVVAIDDATFADLQRQWPFPRSLHGRAVDALRRAGVREIVYDVQFTEPTSVAQDTALYTALGRAGGAVLATSEWDSAGRSNVLGGDDRLAAIGSRAAAANLPDSLGGVLDHFPATVGPLRSLAAVAAARAGGRRLSRHAFGSGGAWIDFRGPPGTIDTVSFSALIAGRVDPARLRGRIVVIGASAPSLQDVHATPTGSEPMSGAEIQANAIWTAAHGLPLHDAPTGLDVGLLVLMACAIPALRLRLRVVPAALAGPLVALAFAAGAQAAFEHGTIVWVATPLLAAALATALMIVASHLSESAARRRVSRDNDVLEDRVRARTRELREAQLEILERLSRAAEWRDEDTGQHVARMGALSQRLARAAGMSPQDAELLGHAAVAHDIGKIAIPDRILLKAGPLTAIDQAEMRRHVSIGASMLGDSASPIMQLAETIARTHHERWDGAGYPDGLRGTEIPLAGRICAVCDVFDALASERPYKQAWPLERVLAELRELSGKHFDPELVEAFLGLAAAAHEEFYATSRPPASSAPPDSCQADEGTRTLDLLHGKQTL